MKICPQCQSTYTDDSLQYCLQDGTPLDDHANASESWASSETLVTPAPKDRIRVELPSPLSPPATQNQTPILPPSQPPPQKSNTLAVILATAFGVLLLVGLGGAAVWFYFKNNQPTVANANTKPANTKTPAKSPENQNANTNANTNVNAAPTATPTPKPTLRPNEVSKIETDVADTIENWRQATEGADIEAQMSNYAPTVNYYNAGSVGAPRVRADKERAFGVYDTIEISISNIKVTPEASGERAVAVFDKEWNFEGAEKYSSGKVQQQLEMAKIDGKWLITSEKDLKVYFVNK